MCGGVVAGVVAAPVSPLWTAKIGGVAGSKPYPGRVFFVAVAWTSAGLDPQGATAAAWLAGARG